LLPQNKLKSWIAAEDTMFFEKEQTNPDAAAATAAAAKKDRES
jgi:hypothetical protein